MDGTIAEKETTHTILLEDLVVQQVMDYNYDGQQGKCTRPGAVGGNLVDMLVEQAAAQWDMQHHPGWTIHHDAACSAMPVGCPKHRQPCWH